MDANTDLWSLCVGHYFPRKITLRSDKTRVQYKYAVLSFSSHLGHAATTADLDDDLLTMWAVSLLSRGYSAWTVREKTGRIISLWNWLAKRRIVDRFPTFTKPDAPDPTPTALRDSELRRLFHSASKERGRIEGVPADLWWTSHLAFLFSTAERKSAALAVRCDWIDLANACCVIPAGVRKFGKKTATYHLWPELVPMLKALIESTPPRELAWPWPWTECTYYAHWGRIATDAGLPDDRKHKAHSLRVSHATMVAALGGDASGSLLHSDPATTRKHYLDARLLPSAEPQLMVPWLPPPAA